MDGFVTAIHAVVRGYLGGDPEMKYTPSGKAVVNVSCGVGGGNGYPTTWVNLVFWEGDAEIANKQLHKGDAVEAKGRVEVKAYERKDGKAGAELKLVVFEASLIDRAGGLVSLGLTGKRISGGDGKGKDVPAEKPAAVPF